MALLVSVFLAAVSCSVVKRNNGRWYEYIGVAILGVLAWFGLTVVG